MNGKLLIALIPLLIITACATPHKVAKSEKNLEGSWVLAVFIPAQQKTLAEVFGDRKVELQFNKATNGVTGTTGCNRFVGTYTADTLNLTFSQNQLLTKMACGDYNEQVFLSALNRINRYRLTEGQLELMDDTDIVMILARKPEQKSNK